jgi:hypothetical protein
MTEIERLETRVKRLETALQPFAALGRFHTPSQNLWRHRTLGIALAGLSMKTRLGLFMVTTSIRRTTNGQASLHQRRIHQGTA